jgi:hypothetical protein
MEVLEGKILAKILLERYAKNPRGWNFTVAPSAKEEFFDAMVSSPEEAWRLKIDSIFRPSPMMLGAKVDADSSRANASPVSFGYRKLSPELLLKILASSEESDLPKDLGSIIGNLDPVVPSHSGAYAQGPYTFTNKKIPAVSESQKQLDDKLSSEMRKLMRNKYASYG